jgi:uroporphyrinogen-III decarboxylase
LETVMTRHSALFQERQGRIRRAISLEPVDRIPVVFAGYAFAPRYMGVSLARICSDPEAAFQATIGTLRRLGDVDGINQLGLGRITLGLAYFWLSKVATPGRELPEDDLWQVREAELMTVEDYDAIVSEGWKLWLWRFLPKVVDVDELRADGAWADANLVRAVQEVQESGYAIVAVGDTTTPFERLCGGRSMAQFYADLYRRPEKVKAAMDVMVPDMIKEGVEACLATGVMGAWVGGWRSASALVAPRLWNTMVFPYLEQVVNGLAEQGVVSVLHLDQDWTRDLARLRDLPAKMCVLNLDGMTDVRKAKEILGDRMAIMGDVPSTLFALGTPDDIYRYVEDLVRDVGPTGLILCPGCDAPVNTKPENMEAFVAAAREFG